MPTSYLLGAREKRDKESDQPVHAMNTGDMNNATDAKAIRITIPL